MPAEPFDIVTTSHPPDFERCRLLCQSIDRHVEGEYRHRIVIDRQDLPLFRTLEGGRRELVVKEDVLPWWVRPTPFRFGPFSRRSWLSLRSRPLSGWLMQQVAKLQVAAVATTDLVVLVDSDVCFVRRFTAAHARDGQRVLLHRVPDAIADDSGDHAVWCRTAARLLKIPLSFPAADYIAQLITWRSGNVRALCDRIAVTTGRHWIAAIADARRFSEYIAYGMFVDSLGDRGGHAPAERSLCHSYWEYRPLTVESCRSFLGGLADNQVAVGIQSISGTPIEVIKACLPTGDGETQPAPGPQRLLRAG